VDIETLPQAVEQPHRADGARAQKFKGRLFVARDVEQRALFRGRRLVDEARDALYQTLQPRDVEPILAAEVLYDACARHARFGVPLALDQLHELGDAGFLFHFGDAQMHDASILRRACALVNVDKFYRSAYIFSRGADGQQAQNPHGCVRALLK
jgi:hypothetical protein